MIGDNLYPLRIRSVRVKASYKEQREDGVGFFVSGKGCFPLSLTKNITRDEAVMANEVSLAIHSSVVNCERKIQQSTFRTSLKIALSSMAEPTIQQSNLPTV